MIISDDEWTIKNAHGMSYLFSTKEPEYILLDIIHKCKENDTNITIGIPFAYTTTNLVCSNCGQYVSDNLIFALKLYLADL